jgi:hypothetical protein
VQDFADRPSSAVAEPGEVGWQVQQVAVRIPEVDVLLIHFAHSRILDLVLLASEHLRAVFEQLMAEVGTGLHRLMAIMDDASDLMKVVLGWVVGEGHRESAAGLPLGHRGRVIQCVVEQCG